jgi:3-phosphoshikimate 1-carboxyvinyltransferase
MQYKVTYPAKVQKLTGTVNLTASKSESNRALIIRALCPESFMINNLAKADDTAVLEKLLNSGEEILDVGPAGTTMRFLTAYLASRENSEKIITGSHRMLERPIGILVDALISLGADITYPEKTGYPPLKINGKKLSGREINISGSVSSQYITALLLIAPQLPSGLKLHLTGKVASRPYIRMTLKMLEFFGVKSQWQGNTITIPHQQYVTRDYTVEGDWSSASYLYSIASLAGSEVDLTIKGLKKDSLQGDSAIAAIMPELGVKTSFGDNEIHLAKTRAIAPELIYNFSDCPDIAQTVAAACAGLGIRASLSGLESLKIKETDRVRALVNELSKLETEIAEVEANTLEIKKNRKIPGGTLINTYKDHRMAMSFAPLAMVTENIFIDDPQVVSKSYPDFWHDLANLGFNLEEVKL